MLPLVYLQLIDLPYLAHLVNFVDGLYEDGDVLVGSSFRAHPVLLLVNLDVLQGEEAAAVEVVYLRPQDFLLEGILLVPQCPLL